MRRLNGKNKIFIAVFVALVLVIAGIITGAVYLTSKSQTKKDYEIEKNSVVFDSDTNLVDTSKGGYISKKWSEGYHYVSVDGDSYELGGHPVVYNKATEQIDIFGTNYQVNEKGEVITNSNLTEVAKSAVPTFYKLDDREYLIIAEAINDADKTVYASRYLIVYLDKQGNASLLNDAINVKTINPMLLEFNEFIFDIANEKLIVGKKTVDLKMIEGSTNEYAGKDDEVDLKMENKLSDLIKSHNDLVSDFGQYSNAANANASATNQIANKQTSSGTTSGGEKAVNNVEIVKRVSLRGIITYPTMIDVTYAVTDPEEKYQAVYLDVTGKINGVYQRNVRYVIDKYQTTYRLTGLSPKNQYSVKLGYTAISYTSGGDKILTDEYEDEINVRTTKNDMALKVTKVADGYVYFNMKMSENFAISSGIIYLLDVNGEILGSNAVNPLTALTDEGYNGSIKMARESSVYTLVLRDARYAGSLMDVGLSKSFTVSASR